MKAALTKPRVLNTLQNARSARISWTFMVFAQYRIFLVQISKYHGGYSVTINKFQP